MTLLSEIWSVNIRYTVDRPSDSTFCTAFNLGSLIKKGDSDGWELVTMEGMTVIYGIAVGLFHLNQFESNLLRRTLTKR